MKKVEKYARIVPVDELVERLRVAPPCALAFPFASRRAARAGDPCVHSHRDALDLFIIALLRLVAHLGEPDFPSAERDALSIISDTSLLFAAWDFDYYVLVLEISHHQTREDSFCVQLRTYPEPIEPPDETHGGRPSESQGRSETPTAKTGTAKGMVRCGRATGQKPHNTGLDLTNPGAAQNVSWPLCLLSRFATQAHVEQAQGESTIADELEPRSR